MDSFAHLRVHSTYTLSEGASGIEDLLARAGQIELPAMALTDRENMFGVMVFSNKAAKSGVQPIVGCQLSISIGENKRGNIILLAQEEVGYTNLCAILRSITDPRPGPDGVMVNPAVLAVDADMLSRCSQGLILLTGGGADGLLPLMVRDDKDMAAQAYGWLLEVFGDRLYVEVCRNAAPDRASAAIEQGLVDLAYGRGVEPVMCLDGVVRSCAPLVATSDVWYSSPDRHEAWLLLGAVVNKTNIMHTSTGLEDTHRVAHHLRSAAEMRELFADLPEAYANAGNIAVRCAFKAQGRKPILPPFACEGGRSEVEELREQSLAGLRARLDKLGIGAENEPVYWQRVEYELGVIERMGFPGYFLIVSDFIKWAKARDIPVGPGRGSGAGSIVAWALTITDLDPLEFNLLFERFLNPDRISMPDFDIDFCQDRREEVRDYVTAKYGADKVALISTFGKIGSKMALKDLQRIFEDDELGKVGFSEVNELTACIEPKAESAEPMGLVEAYESTSRFSQRIDASPMLRLIYDNALKIEGLFRSAGAHAAGVVIGDRPLDELVPIHYDAKSGMKVCDLNMKGAEEAGLVKFDFLGLTNLTTMHLALRYIREFYGEVVDLELIARNDADVYAMLAKGDTTGVFQFESAGMRDVMRKVRPTRFEDLIAIVSLYRPGPMAYIDDYARRKDGETFDYPGGADKTQAVLEETYGIMVYQEQVMQVAQRTAGYSLGGADLLRRAMGKKDAVEMRRQERIFVHGDPTATPPVPGAIALGMSEPAAQKLFEDIKPFANYGFNKSHAAAYTLISYQTAWLKHHYPAAYYAALMSTCNEKRLPYIKESLDALGVPLLGPDINHSFAQFSPEPCARAPGGFAVRFGLKAIKSISERTADLAAERARGGPFASLEDFHRRVGSRYNKAHYERLSEAGAFEGLARSHRQASDALAWLAAAKDKAPPGQGDLLGGVAAVKIPARVLDVPEWGDVGEREFKSVGFYFGKHPIDFYAPRLKKAGIRRRVPYYEHMAANGLEILDKRKLCVMVNSVEIRTSKTDRSYQYITANVSERSDTYQIMMSRPRGRDLSSNTPSIQDMFNIMDGARISRRPVVMIASLKMLENGSGVDVKVNAVQDVDVYLDAAGIRSELVIDLDPAAILIPRDLASQARKIVAGGGDEQAALLDASNTAITRLADEISDKFDKHGRSDAANATTVTLRMPGGQRVLEGRYMVSKNLEHVLRGIDGVVSIIEVAQAPVKPATAVAVGPAIPRAPVPAAHTSIPRAPSPAWGGVVHGGPSPGIPHSPRRSSMLGMNTRVEPAHVDAVVPRMA